MTVTVGEQVISEGLADVFAAELYGDRGYSHFVSAETYNDDDVLAKVASGLDVTGMQNFTALRTAMRARVCSVSNLSVYQREPGTQWGRVWSVPTLMPLTARQHRTFEPRQPRSSRLPSISLDSATSLWLLCSSTR